MTDNSVPELSERVGRKRLLKFISSIYYNKFKLNMPEYHIGDNRADEDTSTVLSELIYQSFKQLSDNGELIRMLDDEEYRLSSSLIGSVDIRRSFQSGVIFDNKVYTTTEKFTYNNKLYRMVRDALFIASKCLIDENDKDASKLVRNQYKSFTDITGISFDGLDCDKIKTNIKGYLDSIDSYLSMRSFTSHSFLLYLCKIVFDSLRFISDTGDELLSLEISTEYIVQLYADRELRRFCRDNIKYFPFIPVILDSNRFLYKKEGTKVEADTVIRCKSKVSDKELNPCIIDVKTNFKFTSNTGAYTAKDNLYQISTYCTVCKAQIHDDKIKPRGVLLHMVFDDKRFSKGVTISEPFEMFGNEQEIRFAVMNFTGDNIDMTDMFRVIFEKCYSIDFTKPYDVSEAEHLYKVKFFKYSARGIFNSSTKELTVLKGSEIHDNLIVKENILFKSCSGAGSYVYGRNSNGWTQWFLESTGQPIDVLR